MGGDVTGKPYNCGGYYVSIHTPVWGGDDYKFKQGMIAHRGFNPHPRMGGDSMSRKWSNDHHVSIHTPVWGVTSNSDTLMLNEWFQSTPPYGG